VSPQATGGGYNVNPADPIIACATGMVRSPRAIIRLSATSLTPILVPHLATPVPEERGISRAEIRFGDHTLPVLLLFFPAPHSYTGQDVAELLIPGNPVLIHRIIDLFTNDSAVRLALPGEFTARAFLAGRMTAEQAEGVQALIASRTQAEADAAHDLLSGAMGTRYRALADDLASALALVEAGIDFTDQDDVVPIGAPELAMRLDTIAASLTDLLRGAAGERTRTRPIRIVLAGPPNAGKSTLFNRILGRERAIAADEPGTTRDVLVEPITARDLDPLGSTWHDIPLELADIAGLDAALAARSPSDAASQSAAHRALSEADVIVWCDPTGRFADIASLPPTTPILRIRTKADLLGGTGFRSVPSPSLGGTGFQPVSESLSVCALDGWNLSALKRALLDAALRASRAPSDSRAAMIPRHHDALAGALQSIRAAHANARPEMLAAHLRTALDHLGSISGRIDPDDVIGRIFATFCVGK